MRLLEYEAKRLLKDSSVIVPAGNVFQANHVSKPLRLPVVLKSQVPIGGRGKAGGVVVVHTNSDFLKIAQKLFTKTIRGYTPHSLLEE